jgi:hypothetical protein
LSGSGEAQEQILAVGCRRDRAGDEESGRGRRAHLHGEMPYIILGQRIGRQDGPDVLKPVSPNESGISSRFRPVRAELDRLFALFVVPDEDREARRMGLGRMV